MKRYGSWWKLRERVVSGMPVRTKLPSLRSKKIRQALARGKQKHA